MSTESEGTSSAETTTNTEGSMENPLDTSTSNAAAEVSTEQAPAAEEGASTLYGELQVKWPEGTEDYLKSAPSIKPFISKEGEVNQASLLKSYYETKKSYGKDRVIVPTENSSEEEISEFYNKLGASSEVGDYKQELEEGASLKEPFMEELGKFAHENKMSVDTVKKLTTFLDAQVKVNDTTLTESHQTSIREGLEKVKTEYGQAYDSNMLIANKVLDTFIEGEERDVFNNPAIGANPAVIKTLVNIGKKIFSEGTFKSESMPTGALSPADAQEEINAMMGDKKHAYHLPQHPSHKDASAKMLKLYGMRG